MRPPYILGEESGRDDDAWYRWSEHGDVPIGYWWRDGAANRENAPVVAETGLWISLVESPVRVSLDRASHCVPVSCKQAYAAHTRYPCVTSPLSRARHTDPLSSFEAPRGASRRARAERRAPRARCRRRRRPAPRGRRSPHPIIPTQFCRSAPPPLPSAQPLIQRQCCHTCQSVASAANARPTPRGRQGARSPVGRGPCPAACAPTRRASPEP